jgi:hypothetical protein
MYCCDYIDLSDVVNYSSFIGDFHFREYRIYGSGKVRERSEAEIHNSAICRDIFVGKSSVELFGIN